MTQILAAHTATRTAHASWCDLHDPAYDTCVTEMRSLPGSDDAMAWAEATNDGAVTVYVSTAEDGHTLAQLDELIATLTELRATVSGSAQ